MSKNNAATLGLIKDSSVRGCIVMVTEANV